MFSLITAYIKNIVILLIFSLFAEMLLPDNRFRGYIKIVTGVVANCCYTKTSWSVSK